MIVIQIYGEDAEQFSGITSAIDFEKCKKRLRLYFKNVGEVKARLFAGEKISMPYVVLQKDRRIRDTEVNNERRRKTNLIR